MTCLRIRASLFSARHTPRRAARESRSAGRPGSRARRGLARGPGVGPRGVAASRSRGAALLHVGSLLRALCVHFRRSPKSAASTKYQTDEKAFHHNILVRARRYLLNLSSTDRTVRLADSPRRDELCGHLAPRQVALGGLREERRRGEAHLGGRIRRRDRSEIEESGEWGGSQGCKQWSSLSSFSLGARGLERI